LRAVVPGDRENDIRPLGRKAVLEFLAAFEPFYDDQARTVDDIRDNLKRFDQEHYSRRHQWIDYLAELEEQKPDSGGEG
jgi:hypothetical protein